MGNSCDTITYDTNLTICNVDDLGDIKDVTGCYSDILNPTSNFEKECHCSGVDCETWYPPTDSGYVLSPVGYSGKFGCVSFENPSNANSIWLGGVSAAIPKNVTEVCITGNPTFTYNTYKPISYNSPPTIINGTYIPPQEKIPNAAYYNYGLFSNPTIEIPLSMNPGPVSQETTDTSNPTLTQNFDYNLNNTPSSYAIFSVTYTIPNDDFTNDNLANQMLDLFHFYETLSNTFTTEFKNSCFYNTTKTNLSQMIMDYCSNSGNMSFSLCSTDFLPFSFLNQSPCIQNIANCKEGFLNFCSNPSNYNSEKCLEYYSESYDGTQLDTDTQVMLQDTCGQIYNSTEDKSTLDENFYTVCGCYLPKDVYSQYLEKNNMNESIIGYPQCWYVPCITSSVLPSTKPQCPSNEITNCIQYKYITVKDTDTNQEQTEVMENALNNCSQINYDFITTTEGPVKENFEIFQEKNNHKINIIFIILILTLIIMILIKIFFI